MHACGGVNLPRFRNENIQANDKDLVWQNLELVAGLLEEVEVLGLGHDRLAKVNRAVDY